MGSDAAAQTRPSALPCIGCLNRCLRAAALHSSHSQGFVPGVEGHRVGEGGVGTKNAMCTRLHSQNSSEQPAD